MQISIFIEQFETNTKSEVWHLQKYQLWYFTQKFKFVYKTSKILNFQVFLKKTPKLKTTTCKFLIFLKKFEKMQKVKSNTFKKINYQIFLEIPKYMYKPNTIFNFHVIHKKTPKLKTNNWKFLVFSEKIEIVFSTISIKMQKVKSNTFKNINYHIFENNTKISV